MEKIHDALVLLLVAALHILVLVAIPVAIVLFFVLLAHEVFKPLFSLVLFIFVLAYIAERCFSGK